jgi:hypothetical protein
MDLANGIAQRLNRNLLSVTKRSPTSSGQFPPSLTSGGGSAPVVLSSRFETGAGASGAASKLHGLFVVPESKVGASGKPLCHTCIGCNGVFCIEEDCETNHRGSGACVAEAGDIHIVSEQGEAFIQPKANIRDVSDDLIQEWITSRESVQDWTAKRGLVNSSDHSLVVSPEEMEASERFSKFADSWKTPAKRGRSSALPPERILPGPEEDCAFIKNLPEDPSEWMQQIGWDSSKEGRVVHALMDIETAFEAANGSNQSTFDIVNKELVSGKATSEILMSKIENLKARFGAPSKDEGPISSPALWGATCELVGMTVAGDSGRRKDEVVFSEDEMERLQQLLAACSGNHWKPFLNSVLQNCNTITASNESTVLFLDGADPVNDELVHLDKRIKVMEDSPGASHQTGPLNDLQARMGRCGAGPSMQVDPTALETDPLMPKEDREALGEKVQRLSTQVHKIASEANEQAISYGGLGLKSVKEVDSWLAAHPCALRHCGLCPDAQIFLEWVADDMDKRENITEQLRKLKKLGFTSSAEARACDSFAHAVPPVFSGDGEDQVCGADKSYFATCKTFASWSAKGWGDWERIKTSMDKVKIAFESQVKASIPSADPTCDPFMLAVSEVHSWMEGFEKEIVSDMCSGLILNQFSDPAAWSLTTRLGVRVLEEVGQHRIGVGGLISSTNGAGNAANVLCATFRTLDEMANFKKCKHKNHPCVSSEFVKFMASNTGVDSVKKFEIRVKTLEGELKEAWDRAKVSSAKADAASNKAEQATKDLAALAKCVKALE